MKQVFHKFLLVLCTLIALGVVSPVSFAAQKASGIKESEIPKVTRSGFNELIKKEKGKVVAVAFFATWCSYCKDEVPEYVKIRKAFPEKELTLLCLSVDRAAGALAAYLNHHEVNYPFLLADGEDIYDFLRELRISMLPHLLLYSRSGERVKSISGFQHEEDIAGYIKEAMTR